MSRVFWPSIGMRASTSPGDQVLAVAHLDQRADREADRHRVVGAGDLDFLAGGVEQLDLRTHHLGGAAALRVDDHQRRQAGHLVDLLGDGDAFLDVLELRLAGELGDDRAGQRVPVGQHRAGLDCWSGLMLSVAPYGSLWRSRSRPCWSEMMISPEREITTSSPLPLVT
jgi:hypothetical protein